MQLFKWQYPNLIMNQFMIKLIDCFLFAKFI